MTKVAPEYNHLFKVLLVGDARVGKSGLLLRFAEDTFTDAHIGTTGVDFKIKTVKVNGKTVKLQLWDTAGQERYRAISTNTYRSPTKLKSKSVQDQQNLQPMQFTMMMSQSVNTMGDDIGSSFRGAHGVMVIYDITDRESFINIQQWMQEVDRYASNDVVRMLVGNKCDLESDREVDYQTATDYANEMDIACMETSAKTSTNVDHAFMTIAEKLCNKAEGSSKLSKPITQTTREDRTENDTGQNKKPGLFCCCK